MPAQKQTGVKGESQKEFFRQLICNHLDYEKEKLFLSTLDTSLAEWKTH